MHVFRTRGGGKADMRIFDSDYFLTRDQTNKFQFEVKRRTKATPRGHTKEQSNEDDEDEEDDDDEVYDEAGDFMSASSFLCSLSHSIVLDL